MHQNTYDHNDSEPYYRRYISNIAYRFKFEVVYEEDRVLKIEDNVKTVIASTDETPRNTLCWKA
jgi:hypothetical protein